MKTDIRRDVLGRLKTVFASVENAIADTPLSRARKQRVYVVIDEALEHVARLEREIERVEIAEGSR